MAAVFDVSPLVRALQTLGERVQRRAQDRIDEAARRTAARTQALYPIGPTGNLKSRVLWARGSPKARGGVTYGSGGVLGAFAKAYAPHSWLYEHGYRRRRENPITSRPGIASVAPEEREALYADLQAIIDEEMRNL